MKGFFAVIVSESCHAFEKKKVKAFNNSKEWLLTLLNSQNNTYTSSES